MTPMPKYPPEEQSIFIDNIYCPQYKQNDTILPEHHNCQLDAEILETELLRRLAVAITPHTISMYLVPLMAKVLNKIRTYW